MPNRNYNGWNAWDSKNKKKAITNSPQTLINKGEVMSTNVIMIERNIPIPLPQTGHKGPHKKYNFLTSLEIGDSVEINGNMPDYSPKAVRCKAYELCKELGMTITIRTLEGTSDTPKKIRIWRIR